MTEEANKYGEFEYRTKLYQRYVNKENPKFKDSYCDCWVPIKSDYKKFTAEDLKTLATNFYSADFFRFLDKLDRISDEVGVDNKPTQRAKYAQAALNDLAPIGMTGNKFGDLIAKVKSENTEAIKTAVNKSNKWLTDGYLKDMIELKLYPLDRAKLEQMAESIDTVKKFTQSNMVANFCADTEEVIDPATNTTKKQYTKSALYAQKALGQLAADGNWKTLYNDIFEVELQKRATIQKLVDQINKKEDAKKTISTNANLSQLGLDDVSFALPVSPIVDQQSASNALTQRGVTVTSGEVFVLPPEVKKALELQGKKTAIAA
jgi:hypothetical protein